MNNLIEIFASLAECSIIVRLCNGFLGFKNEKLKWLKTIVLYIVLALVDIFLCSLEGFENISIFIVLLIVFVYSYIFLNGKLLEKAFVAIIPTVTELPINLAVMGIFSAVADNDRTAVLPCGTLRIPVLFFSRALFFFALNYGRR